MAPKEETQANASGTYIPSEFAAFVETMTKALEAGTSHAAQFPDKSDLMFHRTLDRKFAKGLDASGERVLKLADSILQLTVDGQPKSNNATRIKPRRKLADEDDVVDSFQSTVVDHVDALLEDADTYIDDASGARKKAAIDVKPNAHVMKNLPGPARGGVLAHNLRMNHGIEKPQLLFSDPVDNSPDRPMWMPTLPEKLHAMVPMDFIAASDEDEPFVDDGTPSARARYQRRVKARQHPYYFETRHLPYPTSMFMEREPAMPKSFEDTPFEFVDTPERLAALTEVLLQAKEIAVDLEHHNTRSYYGFTCLMQISTREQDWVVDTLALRSELREHKLGGVMADPSVIKVFHGADSDIVWLQQDFDIYVVNLFDTFHAAKTLDFPKMSLGSLLELYCDFQADKKYQLADWRIRPLPKEMLFYARADTHFLLYVYDRLRNALIARSSRTPSPAVEGADGPDGASGTSTPKPNPQTGIRRVLDLSAETALRLYSRETYNAETGAGVLGWQNMARKLGKKDAIKQKPGYVLKRLHRWRDDLARELDESPHYVLPAHTVIHLAQSPPSRPEVLSRVLGKHAPNLLPRADEILGVIAAGVLDFHLALKDSPNEAQPVPCVEDIQPLPAGKHPILQKHSGSTRLSTAATEFKPATPQAPAPKRLKPHTTVDVWANLTGGKKPVAAKQKPVSALFGKTLQTTASPLPAATSTSASSSLFGHTLAPKTSSASTSRQQSPGFASVQSMIHSGLEKAPVEVSTIESAAFNQATEPETVAFVPAGERKIPKAEPTSTSASIGKGKGKAVTVTDDAVPTEAAPKAGPTVDSDGVVDVRKKNRRKDKVKAASLSAPESAEGSPAPVKKSKKKIKATDIPAFDYAAEGNLLDEPAPSSEFKASRKTKKKDKPKDKPKAKKEASSTSANRRPLSNHSEPKSGNKSGTFMS
ncbi:hypothetical protein CcaverHIS002_0505100 [Cutaneotrichosporon cavernicola]|uniref:HRDC domain-containing protein n=1 Tax=Cutaneotrichosporon cavernicola TaxID=279322 RepID=A0AA48L6Q4_9TREE|nr:uncharacterized protein CcaverHIS019_0505630 [Cutaneotrichosporon cavernicola]BEI85109.1 hypothetical protein CcaverHIS002_0505100 [Cutaneotrichosporon cavernicola]BEI92935.1 hypothetical protein CcaverHIS019_0505630 [Cutaneotrichosporon cavernicola]BEJ00711.1 hypothetical protein CcaverHIS631_0505680 [Cutaneotrichosporon cavernicola]BEJ08478.1 hypothetical protein CcaverHIS641_0505720 [Cutaneotrichosporon cavernicola]